MSLFRIKDLEKSLQSGSIVATDVDGQPYYLVAGNSQTSILTSKQSGLEYTTLVNLVENGLNINNDKINLGGILNKNTIISGDNVYDLELTGMNQIKLLGETLTISVNGFAYINAINTVQVNTNNFVIPTLNNTINNLGWGGKVLFTDINGKFLYGQISTKFITEDTNLYFTEQRTRDSIQAGNGIGYDPQTGIITNTSPGSISPQDYIANQILNPQIGDFWIEGEAIIDGQLRVTDYFIMGNATQNDIVSVDISDTNKGFLFGQVLKTERDDFFGTGGSTNPTPAAPIDGMIVHQINEREGLYMFSNGLWKKVILDTDLLTTEKTPDIIGNVDGINNLYELNNSYFPGSTRVYVNGVRQFVGTFKDYIEYSPTEIWFNYSPEIGDEIIVDYIII